MIEWLYYLLFFITPLAFFTRTSEVFEFNKIILIYIFTTLIITAWITKMIKSKKIIFHRTILDIPLILFLISQIISTLISIDQRTSLLGYYSRFNGGLLSTICYSLLYWAYVSNMTKEKTEKLLKIILISGGLVATYGILEHFGHSISCLFVTGKFNDDCWIQDVRTRVFATLGQPNWLAAFLTSLIPLTWYFALTQKQNKSKLIWIGTSIIFFTCILFTKSRSGLLGLAITFIIFWIFNFKKHFKIFLITNLVLLSIAVIFGTPWTPSIKEAFSHQRQQAVDTGEGGTESGDIRKIVWKGALDIAKHYPIFGTGVETFGYSYWQFRPVVHNMVSEWDFLYNKAHNEYLNFLANTGIFGLLTYLILIGTGTFVLRKNHALLAGFISILITNFFGFSVVVISLLTFLFPAFAIIQAQKESKQINKKDTSNNQKVLILLVLVSSAYCLFIIFKYWYADYLYQSATRQYQAGLYQESVKNIKKAINLSPSEAIFHNQMAKILTEVAIALKENDAKTAKKILPYATNESDIAFSLSPRNMNIRQSRMNMYGLLAQLDSSYLDLETELAKETIPLSPTDPKLELILGKTYANEGKINEAINAIKIALKLKPDYQDAKKALEVLEKLQDKKK